MSFPLWAGPSSIEAVVKCLGREESRIHKNRLGGPVYELNQRLISELVMFNKIELVPAMAKDICKNEDKTFGSVKLLEYLVTHDGNVFVLPKKLTLIEKEIYRATVNEFMDMIPEVFYNYVAQVQAVSARPSCLEDHIPQIKELNRDIKALGQEIPARRLIANNKMGAKIMSSLRDVENLWLKCDEELKKQLEEEKKKREKVTKP